MGKTLLVLAIVLILVTSTSLVIGQVTYQQQTIHVAGTDQYPGQQTPSPSPTQSSAPSPTPTTTLTPTPPTSDATPTPTATITAEPSATPSPSFNSNSGKLGADTQPTSTVSPLSSESAQTSPAVPQFPSISPILIILIVLALGLALAKHAKLNLSKIRSIAGEIVIALLLLALLASIGVKAQTNPSPTPIPTVKFSLWYTSDLHTSNGTAFPITITNCLAVVDVRYVRGGVSPSGDGGRVLVARNDGNVPINITMYAQNVNMPSDLQFNFYWGNYNGASGNPITVAAGQSVTLYLIAEAIAGGYYNSQGQWILNYTAGAPFSYSYDVVVEASQA